MIIVERDALAAVVSSSKAVVERRHTIPILGNILLSAENGRLGVRTTDLDVQFEANCAAQVEAPASFTVAAETLSDIVRKAPKGSQISLQFDTQNGQVRIISGRAKFNVLTLPAEDFPNLDAGAPRHDFEIEAIDFRSLLSKLQFAISTEETRYYLNGIYLHVRDGKLIGVATDGHRLGMYQMPVPAGAEAIPGIIIPRKTVDLLIKQLDGVSGAIRMQLSDVKIRATINGAVLTSKLIDGTFPDYMRVIPFGNDRRLVVYREELATAVDRLAPIGESRTKFAITKDAIELTSANPNTGSASDEVEAEFEGPAIEIGFNGRYVLDLLSGLECEKVEIMLADPGSPALVRDVSGNGPLTLVIMPMRV